MSTRWMAVQYVGDTLRLPIADGSDMDKPFGVSELEREIRCIVVNPFSDNPQTFVSEAENAKLKRAAERDADVMESLNLSLEESLAENAKLRELVDELYPLADYGAIDASELDRAHDLMRELGIEEG